MASRLTIGFFVSLAIWFGIIHYMHIPKDRLLPPSLSVDDMNQTATGYVVKAIESPYADHWYDGNATMEWFLEYKFQPKFMVPQPDKTEKLVQQDTWQTGRIQIERTEYEATVPNTELQISYDPWNPLLNGVHGTGKINTGASFFSMWLLYPLGFIATMILVGEIAKKWIEHDVM